jgi:RHS repeat-associated protein
LESTDDINGIDFTEQFMYDMFGRTILHFSFEGVVTQFIYDESDRLVTERIFENQEAYNAGNFSEIWNYEYDALDREIKVTLDRTGTENDIVTITDYNVDGLVASITIKQGSRESETIFYEYDKSGRQTKVTLDSGETTYYTYDRFGRLASVSADNQTTFYEYDVYGNLAKTIHPNGCVTLYQYDNMNRLIKLTNFQDTNNNRIFDSGEGVSEFSYTLDNLGRKDYAIEKFWTEYGLQENEINWEYDVDGRLIYEKFDHYDDEFDQTSEWLYDLVGNRLRQTVNNKVTTYNYDANDRLLQEISDNKTTIYGYDYTQQTSKSVSENGNIISETTFEYDLQGRMSVVTIVSGNRTEITKYGYGADGIRVSAEHEVWEDGELKSKTRTEYLNDSLNITGYSQVIKQTETDILTNEETVTMYVIGHQRISQIVIENGTEQEYYFTFDGHGSTRALLDFTGAIIQLYGFDAFGNALGFDPSLSLAEFLYSGEQFDSKIGQQYLRARYYDPATGRFNRLDPFFGNLADPQSLHKYLYCHADPVTMVDPTGLEGLISISISMAIGNSNQSRSNAANVATGVRARNVLKTIQNAYKAWDKITEIYGKVDDFIGLLSLDLSDIMDIANLYNIVENKFGEALKEGMNQANVNIHMKVFKLPNNLCDKILKKMKAKEGVKNNAAQEIIGMLATALALTALRFNVEHMFYSHTGLDGIARAPAYDNIFIALESKGGSSKLGYVQNPVKGTLPAKIRQMHDVWIKDRVKNFTSFNYQKYSLINMLPPKSIDDLKKTMDTLFPDLLAMIVKADLRPGKYTFHVGMKDYPGINKFNHWKYPFE